MKKIFTGILIISLLFSCGKKEEETKKNEKKDFLIKIEKLDSLGKNTFLEKSGKLEGKEDIILSSQAIGRVSKINVKQGDKVKAGQTLVILKDTIANYNLSLKKANNAIAKMKNTYDSTKINLDKQIFDVQIALEKLENSLETLKENTNIDISQAKDDLENLNYSGANSKSSIELEKLNNSIEKAKFDYESVLNTNKENILGFKNSVEKEVKNQINFLTDIINFGDKIFDITGLYKDEAERFKDYLGAKNQTLKEETKNQLIKLNSKKDSLKNLNFENLSNEDLLNYLKRLENNYNDVNNYLDGFEKTMINSIPSLGTLGQTQIDAYISANNGFQTQFLNYNGAFVQFKNSISNFLKTYKNNEESLKKQLDLLNKDKELFLKNYDLGETKGQNALDKMITSSNDAIKSLELQIKQTKESLKTLEKSKQLTLEGLKNNLQDTYLAKESVLKEIGKLTVKANIDGIIKNVFVDDGQDLVTGNPIISITGENSSEVELSFKESELNYISVGDKVFSEIGEKSLTGTIYSISSISDDSLNYKVLAIFKEKIQNLGGVIDISIPIKSESILIPLKNVKLIGTDKGIINIYKDGKIQEKEIKLGKMYKNKIEFLGFNNEKDKIGDFYIITNDITNFDETKHNLKIEQ